jgi:hypothetical protein
LRSLRASYVLGARGAPDNQLLKLDGVSALIAPGLPDRSVFNAVVYDQPSALEAALDDLGAAYEQAGVRAWTVWVPQEDRHVTDLLRSAGHVLDVSPTVMGMHLDRLGATPGPEPEWSGDWERLADAGLVSDRAYGDADGTWSRGMGELPVGAGHIYLAYVEENRRRS